MQLLRGVWQVGVIEKICPGLSLMVTHRNTKLNDCQAMEIKLTLGYGCNVTSIAKEYRIHPNTVYQIKHGFTWKHVKL
jgi:hypothetical protein